MIDVFPPEQQEQVRIMIAMSLQGVVTQTLLPTADGTGRIPALEILLPDDAVRNLIRQGKVEQVYSVMQTGTAKGMQTMGSASPSWSWAASSPRESACLARRGPSSCPGSPSAPASETPAR